MEAVDSSETSAGFYITTPENDNRSSIDFMLNIV
jgi:hypothetical protein